MEQLFSERKQINTQVFSLQQHDVRVHYNESLPLLLLYRRQYSVQCSSLVVRNSLGHCNNAMYYFLIRCTINGTTMILNSSLSVRFVQRVFVCSCVCVRETERNGAEWSKSRRKVNLLKLRFLPLPCIPVTPLRSTDLWNMNLLHSKNDHPFFN